MGIFLVPDTNNNLCSDKNMNETNITSNRSVLEVLFTTFLLTESGLIFSVVYSFFTKASKKRGTAGSYVLIHVEWYSLKSL